jgi:hypothetical protein
MVGALVKNCLAEGDGGLTYRPMLTPPGWMQYVSVESLDVGDDPQLAEQNSRCRVIPGTKEDAGPSVPIPRNVRSRGLQSATRRRWMPQPRDQVRECRPWDHALKDLKQWDPMWTAACEKMTTKPWTNGVLPRRSSNWSAWRLTQPVRTSIPTAQGATYRGARCRHDAGRNTRDTQNGVGAGGLRVYELAPSNRPADR